MLKNIRSRKGFTLIELLVVVLIIGILAAIAVPQYFRVVEKGRAAGAVSYAQSVKGAQERAMMKTGAYVVASSLDIAPPAVNEYTVSAITANSSNWVVTFTRNPVATYYGAYVITYNSGLSTPFTCNNASCGSDLIP